MFAWYCDEDAALKSGSWQKKKKRKEAGTCEKCSNASCDLPSGWCRSRMRPEARKCWSSASPDGPPWCSSPVGVPWASWRISPPTAPPAAPSASSARDEGRPARSPPASPRPWTASARRYTPSRPAPSSRRPRNDPRTDLTKSASVAPGHHSRTTFSSATPSRPRRALHLNVGVVL